MEPHVFPCFWSLFPLRQNTMGFCAGIAHPRREKIRPCQTIPAKMTPPPVSDVPLSETDAVLPAVSGDGFVLIAASVPFPAKKVGWSKIIWKFSLQIIFFCYNKQVRLKMPSKYGPIAQLGERSVRIREVEGSNPFRSTKSPP